MASDSIICGRIWMLSLIALLPLLGGCPSMVVVQPRVEQALQAKEFTVFVGGKQKTLTLPEVLSRYDPESKRLATGMFYEISGPQPLQVEVGQKVAFDTYTAAVRPSAPVDFDGKKLQPTLQVQVDTASGRVEPLDDVAKSYFAIEGSHFG